MLVLGDFNLNWLTNDSNSLKDMSDNLNLSQMIDELIRPNLKDPSKSILTDLILSDMKDKNTASGVFALGISDYCPLVYVIKARLERSSSKIVIKRNLKTFNEQAFLSDLADSNIHHTSEIPDVELG